MSPTLLSGFLSPASAIGSSLKFYNAVHPRSLVREFGTSYFTRRSHRRSYSPAFPAMTGGPDAKSNSQATKYAQQLCGFIDASPSPYHAVASAASLLKKAGYTALSETDDFSTVIKPGGKYFSTRNGSSIVAFAVGDAYDPAKAHVVVIGAHTDSPCFRVKPVSKISKHGYLQLGVEAYGGGLWHTWFDRDLTVAGRVILRDGTVKRVHLKQSMCRISNLAIHLNKEIYKEGFKPNKETHCVPIMAMEALDEALLANGNISNDEKAKVKDSSTAGNRHSSRLLESLAENLAVSPEEIIDLELCLTDTQPATIGGLSAEFLFAPRLDNLASCFAGTEALISSSETLSSETGIRMVCLFDHEEVGSVSAYGAASSFYPEYLQRVLTSLKGKDGQDSLDYSGCASAVRRSLCVSADMAHAVHPNYSSKHENNHRVALGGGLVLKTNSNQRYTTSLVTGYVVRECARAVHAVIQDFVVPNDLGCGSTIGPSLSAKTGMRTVDVGMPQLSMHSVREMGSVQDIANSIAIYKGIFEHFRSVDDRLTGTEVV